MNTTKVLLLCGLCVFVGLVKPRTFQAFGQLVEEPCDPSDIASPCFDPFALVNGNGDDAPPLGPFPPDVSGCDPTDIWSECWDPTIPVIGEPILTDEEREQMEREGEGGTGGTLPGRKQEGSGTGEGKDLGSGGPLDELLDDLDKVRVGAGGGASGGGTGGGGKPEQGQAAGMNWLPWLIGAGAVLLFAGGGRK